MISKSRIEDLVESDILKQDESYINKLAEKC